MKIKPLAPNEIEETIRGFTFQASPNQPIGPREIAYGRPDLQWSVSNRDELAGTLRNSETDAFGYYYLALETLMLDGPSRVGLINMQSAGDLQAKPLTSLQVLFQDDAKRTEVRRIVRAAFGFFFVVEPTQLGHLRIRLSTREPIDELEERGIHSAAVELHKAAFPIEEASDGVKAFTGIVTEIIAGDPKILLIDEPEAFLHPSLSFQLGDEISRLSASSKKSLFVSTHSASFVMGCIQSGAPVNIVRLTYRGGIPTARVCEMKTSWN